MSRRTHGWASTAASSLPIARATCTEGQSLFVGSPRRRRHRDARGSHRLQRRSSLHPDRFCSGCDLRRPCDQSQAGPSRSSTDSIQPAERQCGDGKRSPHVAVRLGANQRWRCMGHRRSGPGQRRFLFSASPRPVDGVDLTHRLYIQGVNQNKLSGLAGPGSSEPLSNPGPIRLGDYLPGPIAIFSDPAGVWFPGRGGIWSYSDNAAPKQLAAGTPTDDVHPAGPYL